jgi:hypothetical protein
MQEFGSTLRWNKTTLEITLKRRAILLYGKVTTDGVWIGNGIIGLLCLVTTSPTSTVANSHTLQFTAARTKFSQPALSPPVVTW